MSSWLVNSRHEAAVEMGISIHLIVLLCAAFLLWLIYRYDMYDREPWYLILLALCLGGLSAWLIGGVEDRLIVAANFFDSLAGIAATAAICEEACKLAVVVLIAVLFRRHFEDPMDGIVYGALAGLGFGLEESRFYLSLATQMVPTPTTIELFGQESIRLILHFVTGGMGGFGIGLLVGKVRQWRVILPGWLLATITIHFLWDFACGLPQDADAVFQRFVAVLLMLFALILFGIAVAVGNTCSRAAHPHKTDVAPLVRWPFTLLFRREE